MRNESKQHGFVIVFKDYLEGGRRDAFYSGERGVTETFTEIDGAAFYNRYQDAAKALSEEIPYHSLARIVPATRTREAKRQVSKIEVGKGSYAASKADGFVVFLNTRYDRGVSGFGTLQDTPVHDNIVDALEAASELIDDGYIVSAVLPVKIEELEGRTTTEAFTVALEAEAA